MSVSPPGGPVDRPPVRDVPSGWNAWSFGMLAVFLVLLGIFLWPQWRARSTERAAKPLISALAGRESGARCPRYVTAVFGNVGSVSFDERGRIADRTDLTGPICDGLRDVLAPGGARGLSCLTDAAPCPPDVLRAIVALRVVVHEAMHLRGVLDEQQAECASLQQGPVLARNLGLTPEQGRMLDWLHLTAMNPWTPDRYRLSPASCAGASALIAQPPVGSAGDSAREALRAAVERTWQDLAS